MSPLERIPGIHSELASLLHEAGIREVPDLAQAEPNVLAKNLELLGKKRGRISIVPGIIAVKLFIKAAQKWDPSPELAVNLEDIPEAEVDKSHEDIPEAIIEPNSGSSAPPQVPQPLRDAPASPSLAPRQASAPFSGTANAAQNEWKGVDSTRFQTLEDYAEGGRGIRPLKRTSSSLENGPAKLTQTKGQALARTTVRGVLYPWPLKAILGALVAVGWRLGLLVSCVALPYVSFVHGDNEVRPIGETMIWLGGLALLGVLHLWFINHARCRVCSCHLFFSKRCFKNSRAHLIPGLGYVTSLALHLLLFRWFRCMYCGTAIRLFSSKSKKAAEEAREETSEESANA
jgi:hypothetical protein